ncbi:MAG TPA: hypothetical protein VHJ20_22285 [Polyangia bacterium]|nr:hypothetical protein [Polyangia bacterium]
MTELGARLRAFATSHKPDLGLFLLGVLLRVSMRFTYDVGHGYDWSAHLQTIEWWVDHDSIPRFDYNNTTYHPPLFYWLASRLLRAGVSHQGLSVISIVAGCLRLGVVWLGLELYLPSNRFARVVALGLLAIFPADLLVDGMVTNEGMSTLFSAVAIVLAPLVLAGEGSPRRRHALGAALGAAVGLALMCKFSVAAVISALGVTVAIGLARAFVAGERAPRVLFARVAPLVTSACVAVAIAGWFFVRSERLYGMAAPTGYDGGSRVVVADALAKPFLDRRPIGYLASFDPAIFANPYYPTGNVPFARFWSQLLGTTFSDYFSTAFALPPPKAEGPPIVRLGRAIPPVSFVASCASTIAGAFVFLAVVVAWLFAVRTVWRRRETPALFLLLVPAFLLLGQLTFAIKYPNDTFSPVKGVYMQFGTPPLFGLFGLAVAEAWRRPRLRALAWICLAAGVAIAFYALQTRIPPIPDGLAYWWATRAK